MSGTAIAVNQMALDAKLTEGDPRWSSFNAAFRNVEIDAIDLADKIYTGHAYTSWHNPCFRKCENWQRSQFIAVDMDTEDKRSSIDHLLDHDFVMAYATLLHTTPSHTTDLPRCRVIFCLDRCIDNPNAYTNACRFTSQLLGGDIAATDASRFFYGNCNARIELLRGVLPVDHLYTLYKRARYYEKQNQDRQPEPRRPSSVPRYTGNENKAQTITDALKRIDPWHLDYLEWVSVVAAIKYELGDEGYDLAERWAQGKKGEIAKMWRSFTHAGAHTARIATIVHFAKLAN